MYITVTVKTSAKENSVKKREEDYLVCTKSKPQNNQANISIIKILAEYFDIPRQNITIKSGHKSPKKLIEII